MDKRFRWRWSFGHPSLTQHWESETPAWSQPHTRMERDETDDMRAHTVFALNPICLRHR